VISIWKNSPYGLSSILVVRFTSKSVLGPSNSKSPISTRSGGFEMYSYSLLRPKVRFLIARTIPLLRRVIAL